jgi:TolA-binding protein
MPVELDVHPDDLLHRARFSRSLSRDEQLYLDVHLRDCSTCRFVRDAGQAFDSEMTGIPAAPIEPLVDRTMRRLQAAQTRAARPRAGRVAAGVMTVVAMVGGVAFAGYWGSRRPSPGGGPVAAHSPATPPQHPRQAAGSSPVVTGEVPAPFVAAAPAAASLPGGRRVGHRLAVARSATVPETAARLFEAANRARRQGDIATAEAEYSDLWTRFRASREALASRAIAGQWMLDRGRARAAITLYDQYLAAAPTGDLEEDVLVGLADAHQDLGEREAAAETWRRLLREHPGSIHTARATEGLRRLKTGGSP